MRRQPRGLDARVFLLMRLAAVLTEFNIDAGVFAAHCALVAADHRHPAFLHAVVVGGDHQAQAAMLLGQGLGHGHERAGVEGDGDRDLLAKRFVNAGGGGVSLGHHAHPAGDDAAELVVGADLIHALGEVFLLQLAATLCATDELQADDLMVAQHGHDHRAGPVGVEAQAVRQDTLALEVGGFAGGQVGRPHAARLVRSPLGLGLAHGRRGALALGVALADRGALLGGLLDGLAVQAQLDVLLAAIGALPHPIAAGDVHAAADFEAGEPVPPAPLASATVDMAALGLGRVDRQVLPVDQQADGLELAQGVVEVEPVHRAITSPWPARTAAPPPICAATRP